MLQLPPTTSMMSPNQVWRLQDRTAFNTELRVLTFRSQPLRPPRENSSQFAAHLLHTKHSIRLQGATSMQSLWLQIVLNTSHKVGERISPLAREEKHN